MSPTANGKTGLDIAILNEVPFRIRIVGGRRLNDSARDKVSVE
jgi:hypothetical protein